MPNLNDYFYDLFEEFPTDELEDELAAVRRLDYSGTSTLGVQDILKDLLQVRYQDAYDDRMEALQTAGPAGVQGPPPMPELVDENVDLTNSALHSTTLVGAYLRPLAGIG